MTRGGSLWQQARKTLKGQFITLASAIFILSIVAGLLIMQAFRQSYTDLNTIASGSVPSVDAAQAMSQYIEDIDAKAADYLAAASLPHRRLAPLLEAPATQVTSRTTIVMQSTSMPS